MEWGIQPSAIKQAQGSIRLLFFWEDLRAQKLLQRAVTGLVPLPNNPQRVSQIENHNQQLPLVHCRCISTLSHTWALCTAQFKLQGSFSLRPLPWDWWFLLPAMTWPLVCVRVPYTRKNAFLSAWAGFCFTWRESSSKKSPETPWPEL